MTKFQLVWQGKVQFIPEFNRFAKLSSFKQRHDLRRFDVNFEQSLCEFALQDVPSTIVYVLNLALIISLNDFLH